MGSLRSSPGVLGKRKREHDLSDATADEHPGVNSGSSDVDDETEDVMQDADDIDFDPEDEEADASTLFVGDDEVFDEDLPEVEDTIDPDALYNERMEPFPKLPAYDESLPELKANLVATVQEVLDLVYKHPCDSRYVGGFKAKARELLQIPKPDTIHIALLGEAGVGKSSLINSLLDIPDLAKALASGESCTSCAMEYCGGLEGQTKRFAAEILYYDETTALALLKEHLKAFRENQEANVELDEDQRHALRRASETAVKTFQALFCDQEECSSEEAVKEFLGHGKPALKFNKWCRRLLERNGFIEAAGSLFTEAASKDEFRDMVDPLLNSASECTEPALWPLVSLVRVGVHGTRVLQNVTLTDLPGISDTNQTKVNAANDYLKKCEVLLLVARIDRVVTDNTINVLFGKYEERFKDRIAVICTRCEDNITPGLAKVYEKESVPLAAYNKALADSEKYTRAIKVQKAAQAKIKTKNPKELKKQIKKSEKAIESLERKKSKAEDAKLCGLVESRKAYVKRGLERELKRHLPTGERPMVFCVSNAHYASLKGVEEQQTRFQLTAKGTGVPALRSYLLSLPGPSILQALEDYVKYRFTVFIKAVQLWVIRTYVEGATELLDLVQAPKGRLPNKTKQYRNEFDSKVETEFVEKLLFRVPNYAEAAAQIWARKIQTKHWGTISAFIKKEGNHSTSHAPKESWNAQFSDLVVKDLRNHWPKITKFQKKAFKAPFNELLEDVKELETTLKERPAAQFLPTKNFHELLAGHVVGIQGILRDHQARFDMELSNIRLDCTQERHTAYFTMTMKKVYDKLKSTTGTGSVKLGEEIMADWLSETKKESPWIITLLAMGAVISKMMEGQIDKLEGQLDRILDEVYEYLNGMIDPEVQDSAEAPLREALTAFMEHAGQEPARVEQELVAVKAKYPNAKAGEVKAWDDD